MKMRFVWKGFLIGPSSEVKTQRMNMRLQLLKRFDVNWCVKSLILENNDAFMSSTSQPQFRYLRMYGLYEHAHVLAH